TVESMRHTRAARVAPPRVLAGDRPHRIALNQGHVARLGKKGRDEFRFTVEAEMDVLVALSSRMQGRIYRAEDGPDATPVEVVPPQEGAPPPESAGEVEMAEAAAPAPAEEEAAPEEGAVEAEPAPEGEAEGPPAEPTDEQPAPAPSQRLQRRPRRQHGGAAQPQL